MKYKFLLLLHFSIAYYGCKCAGMDECKDAYFRFTVVDNDIDRNILIGEGLKYNKDTIRRYNQPADYYPISMYIDSAGIIEFNDMNHFSNKFTFFLNKTDSITISYSIKESGFRDKEKCCTRYLFSDLKINNDTLCSLCSDENIFYITIN